MMPVFMMIDDDRFMNLEPRSQRYWYQVVFYFPREFISREYTQFLEKVRACSRLFLEGIVRSAFLVETFRHSKLELGALIQFIIL